MLREESISGSPFFVMNSLSPSGRFFSEQNAHTLQLKEMAETFVLIDSYETDMDCLLGTFMKLWKLSFVESVCVKDSLSIIAQKSPAAILLDSVFPFNETLTKIITLRESDLCKQTPIIVLSGFVESNYKKTALAVGADDYFTKPIDFDLLKGTLNKYIKKYNQNNFLAGAFQ